MSRAPRSWSPRLAVVLASLAIIVAACGGATTSPSAGAPSEAPSSEAPSSAAPPASPNPNFEGMAYPESGEAPCGTEDYSGIMKKITAVDELTVEFQLCAPDPAFLPKVAFSVFGIWDSDYLAAHAPDKSYLTAPVGTGPYTVTEWTPGQRLVYAANPNYWDAENAAKTPGLEFRWSAEAAQRLIELQSGNVDGMDNPGADDVATIQGDSSLQFNVREPLNTFYLGFNVTKAPWTNEKIRQAIAMGVDRQRIVDNFYPEGSEVATHFTPCNVPFGCEGDPTWDFDLDAAKALLAEGMAEEGITSISTKLQFRDAVRGYLPNPPQIATEIQSQLSDNLGIEAELDLQESGTFLDNNAAGNLEGIFLLGWGADYPDPTNFLDYHFGAGSGKNFGQPFEDVAAALTTGATSLDDAARQAAYAEANNLIKQHVPAVIVAHGASGTAFKADVTGQHASPLSNEVFSVMQAADRDNLVWIQNAEPLSLYCGDETDGESLRACEQVNEALYAYEIGGTAAIPHLASECAPNDDATVWTCALRSGVQFSDGAAFDANDVVVSYAAMWDTQHPLHVGRSGAFDYWPGLWGGFLNPPAS
jgi:peptide/nickel transport system substrate-binding protein